LLGLFFDPSLEAESFRKKFFNMGFFGTFGALKEYGSVGAKLINNLPARAAGRTSHAPIIRQGDSSDLNSGTELGNGGEDGGPLCTVGHSIRGVLNVATGEDPSIREQDGCADSKFGIGGMCILHDSRGRTF
jgi:hypothetical protein